MDRDGDLDVVTGIPWSNEVSSISVNVHYNSGNGNFNASQEVASGKGLYSGVLFDIDGDDDLDIIGQNIYSNNGKPYFYENLLAAPAPTPIDPPMVDDSSFKLLPTLMMLMEEEENNSF